MQSVHVTICLRIGVAKQATKQPKTHQIHFYRHGPTLPKGPHATWRHHKNGPKMRTTTFGSDGTQQNFYYPNDHPTMPGWFKGMEEIIKERGLWPEKGLNAQCEGFKCEPGRKDCCCRRLLFTQPDFVNQKSHLEELITSQGHICDFYPKYHCELNFIEQYWGAAKLRYRSSPKTNDIEEMERNIKACLDDVPDIQIRRSASFRASFPCLLSNLSFLSDMQTDQLDLSVLTHRVCQVPRQHGQTGNIMDIGHSHHVFWQI